MAPTRNFRPLTSALDALGASLPMSLGSSVLLYLLIAPQHVGAGVLAAVLSLALVHFFTAHSHRPVFYGARFFEAATVATMVLGLAAQLPAMGVDNTPATRMALLIALVSLAALVVGALWAARAQRLARFIPAPVYIGFANTITIAIVMSQGSALLRQAAAHPTAWVPWAVAGTVLASALATRALRPKWPATAIGLVAGCAWMVGLSAAGIQLPTVMSPGQWRLPATEADFLAFWLARGAPLELAGSVALNAVVIGTLMFLNTVVTGQMLSQTDDRERHGRQGAGRETLALLLAGATGTAPMSGSPTASAAGARHGPIEPASLVILAGLALLVLVSQALVWLPLVAISGVMLHDAWAMWDRGSLRKARDWLRGRPVARQVKEDTLLIVGVMAASLLVNMIAGLLTGLVLGLLLHAVRSTRQPVRSVWTGEQLASNCARSRDELQLLSEHGREIRVFQLDSQQFFASASQLSRTVREQSRGAQFVVMDWMRVEHIDSSVALTIARLDAHLRQQGVLVWHAGTQQHNDEVAAILAQHVAQPLWAADLDRALEQAENLLIQRFNPALSSSFEDPVEPPWLAGLPAPQRRTLVRHLTERHFQPGERLLTEGAPSDEMWLIVRGRCSVYLKHGSEREVRIAGVSPGTTVGEMGFLDGAPRSATVVAETPVQALCMTRAAMRALSAEAPETVQQILTQLTTDLSARLRFANRRSLSQ